MILGRFHDSLRIWSRIGAFLEPKSVVTSRLAFKVGHIKVFARSRNLPLNHQRLLLRWVPNDTLSLLIRGLKLEFRTARIQWQVCLLRLRTIHYGGLANSLHISRPIFNKILLNVIKCVWGWVRWRSLLNFWLVDHSLDALLRSEEFTSEGRVKVWSILSVCLHRLLPSCRLTFVTL